MTTNQFSLPETEQGLLDFIRFAEAEIKRCDRKVKDLNLSIAECRSRLIALKYTPQEINDLVQIGAYI